MRSNIKNLLFCFIVLLGILILSFTVKRYLIVSSSELLNNISVVEDNINSGNWEAAYSNINSVSNEWEKTEKLWSMFINHHEIDNISVSMKETAEFIRFKDLTNSFTSMSILKHYISHIPKMETLSLKNIF